MKTIKRVSALLLAVIMLICVSSCTNSVRDASVWESAIYTEDTTVGQGDKTIVVEVSAEGKSIELTVRSDAEMLGEALIENALIEGDETQYGIYIKKVNGIMADYDVDGYYWSLCKNGEYLMTGADMTPIADGEHYELIRTK